MNPILFNRTVNKQLTYGILLAGLCLSGIMWFLSYNQEKVDAFTRYTLPEEYTY